MRRGVREGPELINPQGSKLKRGAVGRLFFQQRVGQYGNGSADNQILAGGRSTCATSIPIARSSSFCVVLNLRIKAWIYGITAEDYENDCVFDDFALALHRLGRNCRRTS